MKRRTVLSGLPPVALAGCMRLQEGEDAQDDTGDNRVQSTDNSDDDRDGGGNGENEGYNGENDDQNGGSNTNDEVDYPTGLDEDGVSPMLASAHSRELTDHSFTGSFWVENLTSGWDAGRTISYTEDKVSLFIENRGIEYYFSGEQEWWRQQWGGQYVYGQAEYESRSPPRIEPETVTFGEVLESFIRGCSFDPPVIESEQGPRIFTATATAVDQPAAFQEVYHGTGDVESADATLEVDSDGIIRSFGGEFQAVKNGESQLAIAEVQVTDIDETSVSEPDWVETATDRSPRFDAAIGDDGSHVVISHGGGDPVPAELEAALSTPNHDAFGAIVHTSLEVGDSLYLWLEDGDLQWSTDAPGKSDRSISTNWWILLRLNNAIYVYKQLFQF